MNVVQLIQLVVLVLSKAMPLPSKEEFQDPEAVEKWLAGLNGPLATVIALLAAQWDLDRIVGADLPMANLEAETLRVCDERGVEIDPATIIAIVTAIVKLIELWRARR